MISDDRPSMIGNTLRLIMGMVIGITFVWYLPGVALLWGVLLSLGRCIVVEEERVDDNGSQSQG